MGAGSRSSLPLLVTLVERLHCDAWGLLIHISTSRGMIVFGRGKPFFSIFTLDSALKRGKRRLRHSCYYCARRVKEGNTRLCNSSESGSRRGQRLQLKVPEQTMWYALMTCDGKCRYAIYLHVRKSRNRTLVIDNRREATFTVHRQSNTLDKSLMLSQAKRAYVCMHVHARIKSSYLSPFFFYCYNEPAIKVSLLSHATATRRSMQISHDSTTGS